MIIAVANQKGGVAKTTTAVHVAHGLALRGYLVLLVDLDSQGNVADGLGLASGGDLTNWLWMKKKIAEVAIAARDGLDVIRSDKTTAQLKQMLAGMDFRELILTNALRGYDYDFVVLDCPPSVDILHTAALMAADRVIIPTKLEQFSSKGVQEMMRSMATLRQQPTCRCELGGVLPTFYDRVTNESDIQLVNLAESFKGQVWPPIPQDTQVREASREGQTLFEFSPKSRAAIAYNQVLDRVEANYKQWQKTRRT